ncbi:MAG: hypothetical protein HC896_10475 [Bacteroidales bacterium]|nr:hypothetical protein [Bacteroidales bacterium]
MLSQNFETNRLNGIKAYKKNDYANCYRVFSDILQDYPKDKPSHYYAGVCLYYLNGEPGKVIEHLKDAFYPAVPVDIYYYLAMSYINQGNHAEAEAYVEKFKLLASRKEQARLYFHALPAKDSLIETNASALKKTTTFSQKETESNNDYFATLTTAIDYQYIADSIHQAANMYRQRIPYANGEAKALLHQAYANEKNVEQSAQQKADSAFLLVWQAEDSLFGNKRKLDNTSLRKLSSAPTVGPKNKIGAPRNEFVLLDNSQYSNKTPFPVQAKDSLWLIYKIQLGVFSEPVAYNFFYGITPVYQEPLKDGLLTKYYAGRFESYESAYLALKQVRTLGFNDAYIIAWFKGVKTSINRAKEIEKELSGRTTHAP